MKDQARTLSATQIFKGVDRLVDRSAGISGLRAHKVHLLAARRFRELGRTVPPELADEEQASAIVALGSSLVLEQIRAVYDGPLLVMKGPEVAALYPDPALRPFGDIDLLAQHPDEAQNALIRAGFEPVGHADSYYSDRHHLRPLSAPGLPLRVEIHRSPEWVGWSAPPPLEALVAAAVPASVGTEGFLAPSRAAHTLLLAAHSWSGAPLRRLLDLIDVALLANGVDDAELESLARQWDVFGVWKTMIAAAEALLLRGAEPWSLRLWARDLAAVRDRSVVENHVRRMAAPFWALPPRRAVALSASNLAVMVKPGPGESWSKKLGRSRRAFRHAFHDLNDHNRAEPGGAVEERTIKAADRPA